MTGRRMRKVNEVLQEAVAEECSNLKDPRIGFLTITGVSTSPDLRNATVYYSVLGGDKEQADTARALSAAASRIRFLVGARVRLKYMPALHFRPDPAVELGEKVERILRGLDES